MNWIVLVDAELLSNAQKQSNPVADVTAGSMVAVVDRKVSEGTSWALVETLQCDGPRLWRGWVSSDKLAHLNSFRPLKEWAGPRRLGVLLGHCEFTYTFQPNATVISISDCDGRGRRASRGRLYQKDSIVMAKYATSLIDMFVLRDDKTLCAVGDRQQCTK
jgi:hypothetical protein